MPYPSPSSFLSPAFNVLPLVSGLWFLVSTLLPAAPTAEQMQAHLKSRPEIDEIRWKDPARGAPFTVRIIEATASGLTVEKQLPAGPTSRRLPFADIGSVHFGATPVEAGLHQNPSSGAAPALRVLWDARKTAISLPGSNVAETGLAFASSLRATATSGSFEEASGVLDFIIAKAPSPHFARLARAEQQTLSFLLTRQSGNVEQTDELAWQITETSAGDANPRAMSLATAWLADRHFSQLKALENDNPRWIEDPEIKPRRDRLYHLALDFALYPALFENAGTPEAAAGLAKAARIYQFSGETAELKGILEDLAALYPDSPEARDSASLLATLRRDPDHQTPATPTDPGQDEDPASGNDAAPVDAPPPPKRYNLFTD